MKAVVRRRSIGVLVKDDEALGSQVSPKTFQGGIEDDLGIGIVKRIGLTRLDSPNDVRLIVKDIGCKACAGVGFQCHWLGDKERIGGIFAVIVKIKCFTCAGQTNSRSVIQGVKILRPTADVIEAKKVCTI